MGSVLRRWKAIGATGFPDPDLQPHKYIVGEPLHVMYEVWPLVFMCRACGRIQYYRDIDTLRARNDRLGCPSCKGRDQLKQIAYGYVCECGRKDTLFVPRCPKDKAHSIGLVNKGSFQESYWLCQDCNTPIRGGSREGLGFRRCECAPRKGMRGVPLEDSRAHYSQTVALVDLDSPLLEQWVANPRFSDLLLHAVLDTPAYSRQDLVSLAAWKPSAPGLSPELKATLDAMIASGIDRAQAESIIKQGIRAGEADPWSRYTTESKLIKDVLAPRDWSQSRQTVEYVFVRDEPTIATLTLSQLIDETAGRGETELVSHLRADALLASQMGFSKLAVVRSLPILLAGYGYTRYFASPRDIADQPGAIAVSLRPFPLENGKFPLYAAQNTTEGLLYELNPWRLAAFLEMNCDVVIPQSARVSDSTIRAWLLQIGGEGLNQGESHLNLESWEVEEGKVVDVPAALLFGVVHTIAHVLRVSAHRHVGIDADSLAEYLFPAHGSGMIYVSSHVEFTLGGIDSVFRSNLQQWLGSAFEHAGQCSFDPVCSHSGGACLACLYPKFGCPHFNRTVSRAFLFGGEVRGYGRRIEGFWAAHTRTRAEVLRSL